MDLTPIINQNQQEPEITQTPFSFADNDSNDMEYNIDSQVNPLFATMR